MTAKYWDFEMKEGIAIIRTRDGSIKTARTKKEASAVFRSIPLNDPDAIRPGEMEEWSKAVNKMWDSSLAHT